jgi:diketogulonate reductase-like aldo/keto reductase
MVYSASQALTVVTSIAICGAAIMYDIGAPPDPVRTYLKLNNGYRMPLIGLGTWKSEKGVVGSAVKTAIGAGYRHIDCAHVYGNEAEIGEALDEVLSETTNVSRRDLFITSKLWNTDHAPERVLPACKRTLKNLGLSYLDLYLIHWPVGFEYDGDNTFPKHENGSMKYDTATHFTDTWKAMEELVKRGYVRSIGLSNFNASQVAEISAIATTQPAVNQVESHPYLPQEELRSKCLASSGVSLTAYSPLGSPDRPWATAEDPRLLEDPKLQEIAKTVDKTVAQVLLRFQVQRDVVAIPKSVTPSRIVENLQVR